MIDLGEKLLKHMEAEKGASSKHKGHFYRLLTKVLASLLSQRNVVEDMTKVVGSDHGDEICESREKHDPDNSSLRGRNSHYQQVLQITPSQKKPLEQRYQEALKPPWAGRTMYVTTCVLVHH
jgi:hypothetical protein